MTVSDYPKLRLSPDWVVEVAQSAGLELVQNRVERGMTILLLNRRNEDG